MVDQDPRLIDSSGPSFFETPDLSIAPALFAEEVIVQMIESPCPTLMGRTSQSTVPRDSLKKPFSVKWLAVFSRRQMRVRITPHFGLEPHFYHGQEESTQVAAGNPRQQTNGQTAEVLAGLHVPSPESAEN